jgi:hypothetical protein
LEVRSLIFALVTTALFIGGAGNATANGGSGGSMIPAGYLSTRGNQIVDSHGKPVRIACVGGLGSGYVGGHLSWNNGPYKTLDDNLAAMKRFGFNCIRADFNDNNLTDPSIMAEFDQMVAGCKKYGLKVILCHHNDEATTADWSNVAQQHNGLWFDSGPGTDGTDDGGDKGTITNERFLEDWVLVAKRYAGNSTVIGFDLDNEPSNGYNKYPENWGQGGPDDIWAMFTNVGNAIHAVDPGALIICEGAADITDKSSLLWWSMNLTHVATKPVVLRIPHKVVYSVHEYPSEVGGVSPTRLDHGPTYISFMNTDWGFIEKNNLAPVWVGEMGMPFKADDTDGNQWIATILPYLNGQDGAQGGPTFHGSRQPISTDVWRWGCEPAMGDGCMDSSGNIRPEIAEIVNSLLFRPR